MVKAQIVFPDSVAYNIPCSEWVWAFKVFMTGSSSCPVLTMHEAGGILDVSTALKLCHMRHEILRSAYVLAALAIG
jgi:hypothetical protein